MEFEENRRQLKTTEDNLRQRVPQMNDTFVFVAIYCLLFNNNINNK
jgi:hypothetical protein